MTVRQEVLAGDRFGGVSTSFYRPGRCRRITLFLSQEEEAQEEAFETAGFCQDEAILFSLLVRSQPARGDRGAYVWQAELDFSSLPAELGYMRPRLLSSSALYALLGAGEEC